MLVLTLDLPIWIVRGRVRASLSAHTAPPLGVDMLSFDPVSRLWSSINVEMESIGSCRLAKAWKRTRSAMRTKTRASTTASAARGSIAELDSPDLERVKKKKRKRQLGLYMAARHHPQRKKSVALSAYSLLLLTKLDPDNPSRTPFLSTETLLTLFAPKRPQLSYPVVRFCFS